MELRRVLKQRTFETPTNKMAKKQEMKQKEKKTETKIKETKKVLDGIYEIEDGYKMIVNGVEKEFIGENKNAFVAALAEYRVAKVV